MRHNSSPPSSKSITGRIASGHVPHSVWLSGTGLVWLFAICFVVYLGLFLATPLPSLQSLTRESPTRWRIAELFLLLPDEQLAAKWFGLRGSFTILDRLPVLGLAGAILGFAWLLGDCLLRLVRIGSRLGRNERIVTAFAVGSNVVSLYVLAAGLAGWLHQRAAFLAPAGMIVLLAAWQFWRSRKSPTPKVAPAPGSELPGDGESDWFGPRWLWLGAPFVLAIMLGGMLPPIEFDVREYHLQAPKEFHQHGRIEFLPHNVYANMALGSEMFSLLAMVLCGDWWLGALAGKTVVAAFAPLTSLALLAAGRRFFTPAVGYIAALVYISTPWVAHVSTSGLVEGASAFYWLMAVYAVLLWRQRQAAASDELDEDQPFEFRLRPGLLALAGWMAGAAVSCKYPAALFVVAPLTVWIAWTAGARNWKAPVVFLLAALAGCGLWFVKNWALTGNPIYPLLYEWFGGVTRTAAKNEQWARAHYPHEFQLPRLGADLAMVFWRSEWLSPVTLPLAAFSLFTKKYRRTVLALWGFLAYVLFAWWLVTHRIDRFWVPALPLAALLAGIGATCSTAPAWRRLVLVVLTAGMAFDLLFVVAPHAGFYTAYFASLEELRHDASRVGDPWHLYLNDRVPPGWHVLAVGDAQVFDLEPSVLYNTVFDDSILEQICGNRTLQQIHEELLKRRVSHIYVNWGEVVRYLQPGNYGFPKSITPGLFAKLVNAGVLEEPLRGDDLGEVYRVRGAPELEP